MACCGKAEISLLIALIDVDKAIQSAATTDPEITAELRKPVSALSRMRTVVLN